MRHLLKGLSFFLFFISINSNSFSQNSFYPQGYFRNPLDIPIQLVSNFGELRPNHFHMGLDIRTQGHANLPVHAAAEGYVSHIKIEKGGFGNAIYINHPNGFTTLYAHLNTFYPALYDYIKAKEYKEQKVTTIYPDAQKEIIATHTFSYNNGLLVLDVKKRIKKK